MVNLIKFIKKYSHDKPITRKIIGVILMIVGLIALVTPLTPGSWLFLIGFELLGLRVLFFPKNKKV